MFSDLGPQFLMSTHREAGNLHAVAYSDDDAVVLARGLEDIEEFVVGIVLLRVDATLAV